MLQQKTLAVSIAPFSPALPDERNAFMELIFSFTPGKTDVPIELFRRYAGSGFGQGWIDCFKEVLNGMSAFYPRSIDFESHVSALSEMLPVYIAALRLSDSQINDCSEVLQGEVIVGASKVIVTTLCYHLETNDTRGFIKGYSANWDKLNFTDILEVANVAAKMGNGWALLSMKLRLEADPAPTTLVSVLQQADLNGQEEIARLLMPWITDKLQNLEARFKRGTIQTEGIRQQMVELYGELKTLSDGKIQLDSIRKWITEQLRLNPAAGISTADATSPDIARQG
jgi:hypothetical protein